MLEIIPSNLFNFKAYLIKMELINIKAGSYWR